MDRMYRCGTDGDLVFVEVPAPTDEAQQAVLQEIIGCVMKLLTAGLCWSKIRVRPA